MEILWTPVSARPARAKVKPGTEELPSRSWATWKGPIGFEVTLYGSVAEVDITVVEPRKIRILATQQSRFVNHREWCFLENSEK